ncbi:MAG: type VI secretion system baseplate subunit TssK [Holosporaceae bacterium]|jgi:type VI secretion system protein ImpJ|nr:type VI secretion system baseplate subunit TssK [Holosporaceae bacterium]
MKKMESFVQWHEGMLLSPHHFQQSDNHVQRLLSVFGSSCTAFGYGVYDLKIDTSALAAGVIRVLKANGIFQDGFYFDFDAVHDQPLEKNLGDYFAANSKAVKVYLAITARKDGENELTGEMARYYSDELANICDENTGENPVNIPILKPRLKLLLQSEVDARYVSFPIFEAEKSLEGGVVGTNFLPPFIALDEHSKISELCREVAQVIRNKVSYFSDRKNNYASAAADESLASLRLLIQAVLPLEAIIRVDGIQPFEVYRCLINTISKIISINPVQLIPRLTVYDHSDLFFTFDGLLSCAKNILNQLKQQYEIIHFEKDESVFKLQFKKGWLEKEEISIGIQKTFAMSNDDVLAWVNGVQIASESMLPAIRDKRILGAERKILERGALITAPDGMIIISVKTKTAYIKPSEKLCLLNGSQKTTPEDVVLYADVTVS